MVGFYCIGEVGIVPLSLCQSCLLQLSSTEAISLQRKIIHIDMDAFYASVEQRDNPAYRGVPIVVGGSPEGRGGVVATASYEARKYGIKSAMPSKRALQLCPHVVFVYPRFAAYKEASERIREIFHRYTDLIEPLSLDEAFLDVTVDKQNIGSALKIAREIKLAIRSELNLTASAGVSVNKFVAKIASDLNKPDGLTFIPPHEIVQFMERLPVEKFFGVGRVTAEKMKGMGLHTGADLKQLTETDLTHRFGKSGTFFYNIVRGIDNRAVVPDRESKSVGAEDTFAADLTELADMTDQLGKIAGIVAARMQKHELKGRTITLKIKYHDFKQITRNQSFAHPLNDALTIAETAQKLLAATDLQDKRIRLLGISLSNFGEAVRNYTTQHATQLSLFP